MASTRFGLISLMIMSVIIGSLMIQTETRYLPTRSQNDHLDKLSELLRDILEYDPESYNTPSIIDYRLTSDNNNNEQDNLFDQGLRNAGVHYPKHRANYKY